MGGGDVSEGGVNVNEGERMCGRGEACDAGEDKVRGAVVMHGEKVVKSVRLQITMLPNRQLLQRS